MLAPFRKALRTGIVTEPRALPAADPGRAALGTRLTAEVASLCKRSLHIRIRQVDAGAC